MTTTTTTQRPAFYIKSAATIKHLNVRKEGEVGAESLALDLKLVFKGVDRRLCAYFDDALEAFLWRGDTDALIARNAHLAPVQYGNYIYDATAKIGSLSFGGVDIKKFSLVAKDGGVMDMGLSVTLIPSSADVATLSNLLQDEVSVTLEGPPDLFTVVAANSSEGGAA